MLSLAAAADAQAARVFVETDYPDSDACRADCPPPTYRVVFLADRGEVNDVIVTRPAEGPIRLRDNRNPVVGRNGCLRISRNEVSCRRDAQVQVRLRDRNDGVLSNGGRIDAEGGAGDDRLFGSEAADRLSGGPGADRIFGGPGDDTLLDHDLNGRVGLAGDDAVDGGDGIDVLSYERRVRGVHVTLGVAGSGGQRGERDAISFVESLNGGAGDDVLIGDEGANRINGGNGDDRIEGAGGDDQLAGGIGEDSASGGDGADLIRASESDERHHDGINLVTCGPGEDRVVLARAGTRVHEDCERTWTLDGGFAPFLISRQPMRSLDDPVLEIQQQSDRCCVTAQVRASRGRQPVAPIAPRTLLAESSSTPALPPSYRTPVYLTQEGRALLSQHRVIRADVYFQGERYEITLRLP
jgi:hypothetical protein